jgi:hypothetical protein
MRLSILAVQPDRDFHLILRDTAVLHRSSVIGPGCALREARAITGNFDLGGEHKTVPAAVQARHSALD